MKKFEYKNIDVSWVSVDDIERKLNNLGKDGWELVSCVSSKDMAKGESVILFLKREINIML